MYSSGNIQYTAPDLGLKHSTRTNLEAMTNNN